MASRLTPHIIWRLPWRTDGLCVSMRGRKITVDHPATLVRARPRVTPARPDACFQPSNSELWLYNWRRWHRRTPFRSCVRRHGPPTHRCAFSVLAASERAISARALRGLPPRPHRPRPGTHQMKFSPNAGIGCQTPPAAPPVASDAATAALASTATPRTLPMTPTTGTDR